MRVTNQVEELQSSLGDLEASDAPASRRAETHFMLAVAHLRLQENEIAIGHLQKCLAFDPTNAVAEAYLGAALAEEYQIDAARDHLERAVELAPQEMLVHLKLGEFKYRLGIYPEALRHFEQAARLQSPNAATAQYLTTLLEKTRKHNRNIIARDPKVVSFKGASRLLSRFKKTGPDSKAMPPVANPVTSGLETN